MSGVDIALGIIILIGAYSGYREGFLMELFSFAALLLGVLGGFKLMGWAMLFIADQFDIAEKMLPYVAFAVVFIIIVIVVRLLGKMIKVSIDKTFLGRVDDLAGAFLGLFKTIFLLSVAIWIIQALNLNLPNDWTEGSWLFPHIEIFAPLITSWISEIFPIFRDVF